MKHSFRWIGRRVFQPWFCGFATWMALWSGLAQEQASARPSVNPLLLQVQQCIQQKLKQTNTAVTPEITTRCVFSVVMLNPDGTVRSDASDRMTALMRATGTALPKPQFQGEANVALQQLPSQSLFTLPVNIQGQTFSFILDSGASNSILDNQIAQQLGLKGQPIPSEMLAYLAVGQQFADQKMSLYRLPPLQVGRAQVSKLYGIGLSTKVLPFKTAGILGLDFLSRFDIILHPQRRTLQLVKASRPVASGLPLEGRMGVMTTPTYVNGKGPYRFLVDTGASATSLSERLVQRLSIPTQADRSLRVAGLGGQTQAKRARLDRFGLQTQQLTKLNVLVVNSPIFQTLGIEGIIGQDVLNRYVQHWRFGPLGPLGAPERGSLHLFPLPSSSVNRYIGSWIGRG
ncbi:retropepsin-like aspartic protease [Altericista sp. CCNU0014]|uniref:retropepsin-like aspartic protease n=1 Tax=Altericista sp. CCNU0014 TaxID=3082949 RepID=UPI00384BBD69